VLITVEDVQARTGQTYTDTDLARVNAFIEDVSGLIADYCYPLTIPSPTPATVKAVAALEVRRMLNVEPGVAQERIDNLSESFEAGGATLALSNGAKDALNGWKRTQRKGISTLRLVTPRQYWWMTYCEDDTGDPTS
jgi:hypothetical protein